MIEIQKIKPGGHVTIGNGVFIRELEGSVLHVGEVKPFKFVLFCNPEDEISIITLSEGERKVCFIKKNNYLRAINNSNLIEMPNDIEFKNTFEPKMHYDDGIYVEYAVGNKHGVLCVSPKYIKDVILPESNFGEIYFENGVFYATVNDEVETINKYHILNEEGSFIFSSNRKCKKVTGHQVYFYDRFICCKIVEQIGSDNFKIAVDDVSYGGLVVINKDFTKSLDFDEKIESVEIKELIIGTLRNNIIKVCSEKYKHYYALVGKSSDDVQLLRLHMSPKNDRVEVWNKKIIITEYADDGRIVRLVAIGKSNNKESYLGEDYYKLSLGCKSEIKFIAQLPRSDVGRKYYSVDGSHIYVAKADKVNIFEELCSGLDADDFKMYRNDKGGDTEISYYFVGFKSGMPNLVVGYNSEDKEVIKSKFDKVHKGIREDFFICKAKNTIFIISKSLSSNVVTKGTDFSFKYKMDIFGDKEQVYFINKAKNEFQIFYQDEKRIEV